MSKFGFFGKSSSPGSLLRKARAAERAGDKVGALSLYEGILKLHPDSSEGRQAKTDAQEIRQRLHSEDPVKKTNVNSVPTDLANSTPSQNCATSGSKQTSRSRLTERDNVGTRIDTDGKGSAYFLSLFHRDPEPIIFYFFNNEEQATRALTAISCIAVAEDSGKLICTEPLTFGVFPTTDGNSGAATWGGLLAGKVLSLGLWLGARECFQKHGGKMRREDAPTKTTAQKQPPSAPPNTGSASSVTFVRDTSPVVHGTVMTKKIYKAPDKETAFAFLRSQTISRQYSYIEIETPSGWVGKDKEGTYEF